MVSFEIENILMNTESTHDRQLFRIIHIAIKCCLKCNLKTVKVKLQKPILTRKLKDLMETTLSTLGLVLVLGQVFLTK